VAQLRRELHRVAVDLLQQPAAHAESHPLRDKGITMLQHKVDGVNVWDQAEFVPQARHAKRYMCRDVHAGCELLATEK
jgi:hypothetical protein